MHNENMTGHFPKNDPKGWEVSATSNLNLSKSKHHGSHGCLTLRLHFAVQNFVASPEFRKNFQQFLLVSHFD